MASEFPEGSLYIYNTQNGKSSLLIDGVLINNSEAWITKDDQFFVFQMRRILLLDKNRNVLEKFDFKETELVLGAQYDETDNKAYFLLKDFSSDKINLCQFKFENKELRKIMEMTDLKHDNIEEPFKKIFIFPNNCLLIEDFCDIFYKVNLRENSIRKIIFDEGVSFGCFLGQNKNGVVCLKYLNSNKTSYELKEYSFVSGKSKLLLDGKNKYSKPVFIKFLSDPSQLAFLVEIDEKLYLYDYSRFTEVKINFHEILSYQHDRIVYTDSSGKVTSIHI
ncbi:MAG TPA: hypothetical protein VK462_00360 [Nitrososphaeraceae archaeon]|nr:hypothetical protein [Nitrososphaeraceae archaeon]